MIDLNQSFAGMRIDPDGSVRWTPPRDLPYFDGHFPGNPIFPAVGIVDASIFALARVTGRPVELEKIASAKFTQVLQPGVDVVMRFQQHGPVAWSITWTLTEGGRAVAELDVSLRANA